jgi:ubiquinone/menaquinone biosynthesis C-methylase UbiE
MTVSAYDDIAEWYRDLFCVEPVMEDPFFPAVQELMGDITGQRVCDLACGEGRVSRHLADRGARVTGIDLSSRLLAMARQRERAEPRGVAYLRADAQGLYAVRDAVFDGVVCNMALMDIPELAPTLRAVARVLRRGGWLVFSILHPCYNTRPSGQVVADDGTVLRTVGEYFTEGFWRSDQRPGPPGRVGAYHRTLATYVNTLADAGLVLERLCEPRGGAGRSSSRPVWQEVPPVLVARCRRAGRAGRAARGQRRPDSTQLAPRSSSGPSPSAARSSAIASARRDRRASPGMPSSRHAHVHQLSDRSTSSSGPA